jgi:hypothetical protein
MSAAFSNEDRQKGYETMTAKLSPAARVRRRFLQGRTAKRDVVLSPLSAVSAAVESLTEVLGYIAEKEPTLAACPENAGVVLVYFAKKGDRVKHSRVFPDKRAHGLLKRLAALPDLRCIGLVLFIQERVDGDPRVSGWTKPFLWDYDDVEVLNSVLDDLLTRFGKGAWLIQ